MVYLWIMHGLSLFYLSFIPQLGGNLNLIQNQFVSNWNTSINSNYFWRFWRWPPSHIKQDRSSITAHCAVSVVYLVFIQLFSLVYTWQTVYHWFIIGLYMDYDPRWLGHLRQIDIFSMAFFPKNFSPQTIFFLYLFYRQSLIGTECERAISSYEFFFHT